MIAIDTFLIFLITTFVVVISPGPAVIAVAVESASSGLSKSFGVIAGIAMGNVVFFVLSATGIAALITASSLLFSIIKWTGVAYLFYLGVTAIFSKSGGLTFEKKNTKETSYRKAFLRGFILELSNPKALLYFSALLPQFININQPVIPQLAIFGALTLLLDFVCYGVYAYFAYHSTKHGLKPLTVKIINRTAGGFLIFAGAKMATASHQ